MSPWRSLLYQALASPYGIVVAHEYPESARSLFYNYRRGDPELAGIQIILLEAEPNHLYLCRKDALASASEITPPLASASEITPCPKNPPPESISGSTPMISNGSKPPTGTISESPRLSERSSARSADE